MMGGTLGPLASAGKSDKTGHAVEELEARVEQDADGIITDWDSAAEYVLGWPRLEAIGKRSHELIPGRNRERHDRQLQEMLGGPRGQMYEHDITALHREGHELPVHVRIAPRQTGSGVRLVAYLRPTTPPKRAAAAMDVAGRYRAILDQIEDGCCVVDLRGNYLFANDAFCRMFNYRKEDIIGASFKVATGSERVNKIRAVYAEVYRTGQPAKAFEYEVFPKDRPPMFVDQSVSLERDSDGRPIGFVSITRDCTARKQAEQELDRARQAAEGASRAKSEFLANMSHEIRTPMNGVVGMTELALATELTPYQADCLTTVKASAESLLAILNDILDFSKIEARKVELESVPFCLRDLVKETLKPLAVRARQKGIELHSDIGATVPAQLVGDPVRLQQVFRNLVSNAIKFTERGRVALTIRHEAVGAGGAQLHAAVTDTGPGIPPDKHATIFEAFSQADGSTTRRFGGTGLGLAISSTLVHLMGGRIWVESEPGVGSTFHFTASFTVAPQNARLAAMRSVPCAPALRGLPEAIAPMRILLAEDNVVNRRVAVGLLTNRGHLVTATANGREALAALERGTFDLVLMDVQMPEMDGFEATAAIRSCEREHGGHVRIIAMTAHAMNGDRERCLAAGMDGYLSKPIGARLLYDVVEQKRPSRPEQARAFLPVDEALQEPG